MGLASTKTGLKNNIKNDFKAAFTEAQTTQNLTPAQAAQVLDTLCDKLANSITERIFSWLNSNKKIVNSATVAAHPTGSYVQGEVHNSKSNDQCGLDF